MDNLSELFRQKYPHSWLKGYVMASMLNGRVPWEEGCIFRNYVDTLTQEECLKFCIENDV